MYGLLFSCAMMSWVQLGCKPCPSASGRMPLKAANSGVLSWGNMTAPSDCSSKAVELLRNSNSMEHMLFRRYMLA